MPEELALELDLSELEDELEDFSVDGAFASGFSDDFSAGDDEEGSLLPLEPLTVVLEESRLSLR